MVEPADYKERSCSSASELRSPVKGFPAAALRTDGTA